MGNDLSNKYVQKLLDSAKKSRTDAIKTASKRAIQKAAETTSDLSGNKIADKITSVSKKSAMELHSKELPKNETRRCRNSYYHNKYISPEERQQIINELRLVPKKDEYF